MTLLKIACRGTFLAYFLSSRKIVSHWRVLDRDHPEHIRDNGNEGEPREGFIPEFQGTRHLPTTWSRWHDPYGWSTRLEMCVHLCPVFLQTIPWSSIILPYYSSRYCIYHVDLLPHSAFNYWIQRALRAHPPNDYCLVFLSLRDVPDISSWIVC